MRKEETKEGERENLDKYNEDKLNKKLMRNIHYYYNLFNLFL